MAQPGAPTGGAAPAVVHGGDAVRSERQRPRGAATAAQDATFDVYSFFLIRSVGRVGPWSASKDGLFLYLSLEINI